MSFLSLPPEIRLQIYPYLLKPNSYTGAYKQIRHLTKQAYDKANGKKSPKKLPSVALPRFYVTRSTPAILLVNRQITREALEVLYSTELTLYGTPSTYFVFRQMDIAEFISETLLQRVQYVVLKLVRSPEKLFVLTLLDIWGRGNELKRLVVYLPRNPYPGWNWGVVKERLRVFAKVSGIPLERRFIDTKPRNSDW
ncbi:hypothetical protein BJY01DRAFT_223214 [Aspergillus pseudoustus]|uniref:2EXR domain-containing protein n=1 Tax=Aspergillus pseudoustus TaxID=1810923 RepID=A0ABR4J9J4_9EURO